VAEIGIVVKENLEKEILKTKPVEGDTHQLEITLTSGHELIACDSNGASDPYVKFKLNDETVYKSRCHPNTLQPRWDEKFTLMLSRAAKLSVHVFDRDRGSFRDDFMGCANISLHEFEENGAEKSQQLFLTDMKGLSAQHGNHDDLGYLSLNFRMTPLPDDVITMTSRRKAIGSTTSLNITPSILEESREFRMSEVDRSSVVTQQSVVTSHSRMTRQPSTSSLPYNQAAQLSHESSKKSTPLFGRKKTEKKQSKSVIEAVAKISLVSGTDLPARDSNGFSDPYVKFHLNKVKRKSKTCFKTLNPVWKQDFEFELCGPETSKLLVQVWDKDALSSDFIGQLELDLWSLEREKTHKLTPNLVDSSGSLCLLVTVNDHEPCNLNNCDYEQLRERYSIKSTFSAIRDVGFAEINILSASGLKAADIGGKSDPFCIVKLCNAHAQTHTCKKTLDPVWNRSFTFPILDIHDVFELYVYDADDGDQKDFLGRVSIPILSCENGKTKTYELKDIKLNKKEKGSITVKINYIYNVFRAALRTFNPREENLMLEERKFKKSELTGNFSRAWRVLQSIIAFFGFIKTLFTWEDPKRSFIAFFAYVMIVWNFELYMLPISLILLFMKNYTDIYVRKIRPTPMELAQRKPYCGTSDDDDDDDKQSFLQKIDQVKDVLLKVQTILDYIASFGERCHHAVTWSVPYLGWVATVVIAIASLLLYFVPLRVILLLWGVNKFTKRLRNPNYIDNNELLDYLSRVPSSVELHHFKELPRETKSPSPTHSKKKKN